MRLLTKACIKVRTLSEEFFRTMEYYQIKITTKSLRRMLINTFKVSIRNCAFTIKLWTKKYSDLVRQCFSPFYSMYNTILGQLLYILYRQTIVPSALVSLVALSIVGASHEMSCSMSPQLGDKVPNYFGPSADCITACTSRLLDIGLFIDYHNKRSWSAIHWFTMTIKM